MRHTIRFELEHGFDGRFGEYVVEVSLIPTDLQRICLLHSRRTCSLLYRMPTKQPPIRRLPVVSHKRPHAAMKPSGEGRFLKDLTRGQSERWKDLTGGARAIVSRPLWADGAPQKWSWLDRPNTAHRLYTDSAGCSVEL